MTADRATATAESVRAHIGTEPPRLTGSQTVTNKLIASIGTSQCGWSKRQLKILGVSWPSPAGWRQRLVAEGRSLTGGEVDALYAARKPKRTAEADPAEIPVLPCPWCRRLVEPVMQGGNTREFCCRKHKNSYNAALNRLSLTYARTIRVPGSLKIWAEQRVDPSPSGAEGSPRPIPEAGQEDGPSAPARPDVV